MLVEHKKIESFFKMFNAETLLMCPMEALSSIHHYIFTAILSGFNKNSCSNSSDSQYYYSNMIDDEERNENLF